MASLTRDERRINRGIVLDALFAETGANGGDMAAARVKAYRSDPKGATTTEFSYVGALTLRRWYIDDSKPNGVERQSLWQELKNQVNKPGAKDPGGWDGTTAVMTLQAIVEGA